MTRCKIRQTNAPLACMTNHDFWQEISKVFSQSVCCVSQKGAPIALKSCSRQIHPNRTWSSFSIDLRNPKSLACRVISQCYRALLAKEVVYIGSKVLTLILYAIHLL